MKFSVKRSDILDVLANIQGITGKKTSLAITETVLIRVEDSSITINATDLKTSFEGVYPADVESEGTIAINSRKFYEIVRDFPQEVINVKEVENYWIYIGNDIVKYNIGGMNPDNFPDKPNIEDMKFFNMSSGKLKWMIEKTIFIKEPHDDKRSHLIGNYFDKTDTDENTIISLVSTDGGRLAKVDCFFEKDIEFPLEKGVIIPKTGLNEIVKFLDPIDKVGVNFENNNFSLKKEQEIITTRLLDGDFPNYKDIILMDEDNGIIFDRALFLMMLKRMAILSSRNHQGAIFIFKDDTIKINSTNPEIGESKEDMKIDYKRPPLQITFNIEYFIDALNIIEDERVVINVSDDGKPCIIKGERDNDSLCVIMPMKE